MSLVAVDHVQLAMPPGGEDRARAFYTEVLGLTEVAKPAVLAARGGCWFENDAVKVHLGIEPGFQASAKAHVAFQVGDLVGLLDRARAAGSRTAEADPLSGVIRAYVYDPFGNRIELIEPGAGD